MNLDQFTEDARRALHSAHREALRLHHGYLRPEQIALGLIKSTGLLTLEILDGLGLDPHQVADKLEDLIGEGGHRSNRIRLSHQGRRYLAFAVTDARQRGDGLVSELHLFRALADVSIAENGGILEVLGVDPKILSSILTDQLTISTNAKTKGRGATSARRPISSKIMKRIEVHHL